MFWILRRTRLSNAASLFNSANNNNNNDGRPARRDYDKLLGDEQAYQQQTLLKEEDDDPQESNSQNSNANGEKKEKLDNSGDDLANRDLLDTDSESTFPDLDLDGGDFSEDSDYDEALTCNVCDRSFACPKQLASHKQKKRHFGCSACDSLFPSLMALEHHKEEFEHWSGDEDLTCTDSEGTDDETVVTEERERLL